MHPHHFNLSAPAGPHRLFGFDVSARLKLLVIGPALLLALLSSGPVFPLSVAALCLMGALSGGLSLRHYLGRFAEPAVITSVIVILRAFSPAGEPLVTLPLFGWALTITREGLLDGGMLAARIAGSVSLLVFLGLTTPFSELLAALSWLRIPRTFVDILMLAHRYIFVLMDDALVIYQAQRNRLGYTSIRKGLSSFATLAGSLMLRSLEQSTATTTAMVQRGYEGRFIQRCEDRLGMREAVAAFLSVLLLLAYYALVEGISA